MQPLPHATQLCMAPLDAFIAGRQQRARRGGHLAARAHPALQSAGRKRLGPHFQCHRVHLPVSVGCGCLQSAPVVHLWVGGRGLWVQACGWALISKAVRIKVIQCPSLCRWVDATVMRRGISCWLGACILSHQAVRAAVQVAGGGAGCLVAGCNCGTGRSVRDAPYIPPPCPVPPLLPPCPARVLAPRSAAHPHARHAMGRFAAAVLS